MDDFGRCVIRTSDEVLSPESAARFRALKREIDAALRELLAEAVADGSCAPLDVKLAAFTLAGALNWPARWFQPPGSISRSVSVPGIAHNSVKSFVTSTSSSPRPLPARRLK